MQHSREVGPAQSQRGVTGFGTGEQLREKGRDTKSEPWSTCRVDRVSSARGPTYLPEEGGIPLHTVTGVRGLDLRVKGADHIVQHLYSDVISPHARALAPRVLICGLKNLKGPEPGGKTHVFNRSDMALALVKDRSLAARPRGL